jgi:hypothetical protein
MLHILNGDATAEKFRPSGIGGDIIVWREELSEGPAPGGVPEKQFWEARAAHIFSSYGEDGSNYRKKVLDELERFNSISRYKEIVLWFEFDLFCQINLMYILNYLKGKNLSSTISLVCIENYPGIDNFKGLGELSPSQLEDLLQERKVLNKQDLESASSFWKAYSSNDPSSLEKLPEYVFKNFPLLKPALIAHLERFPSVENGLNRIEQKILYLVSAKARTRNELFLHFWEKDKIYGMGDYQLMNYLKQMEKSSAPLLKTGEHIELTKLGEDVMKGKKDFIQIGKPDRWLGGVHISEEKNNWRWDKSIGRLIFVDIKN